MSNFIERLEHLRSEIDEQETWEVESYNTQSIAGDYEGVTKIKGSGENGRGIANLSEWAVNDCEGDADLEAEIITLLFNKGLPALSQLRNILRPAVEAARERQIIRDGGVNAIERDGPWPYFLLSTKEIDAALISSAKILEMDI